MNYSAKTLIFLGGFCVIGLSACDQQEDASTPATIIQFKSDETVPSWLDGQVDLKPQEWLVLRSRAVYEDFQTEADRAAHLLVRVSNRYDESHRMVANRAAQLEDMLHEQDLPETAVDLLEWFADLPAFNSPHSFSALCQYYMTLRKQGQTPKQIENYWTSGQR